MRFAVSAGSGGPEGEAYVQGLQGKLLSDLGRYGAAEHAYREAFAINPGYPPALAGIAGVEAGRGEFGPAIHHYRDVVERLPLPEYAIALGETEEAAGRIAGGQARLRAGRGRGEAAARQRRQHRRRPGAVRGQPRQLRARP